MKFFGLEFGKNSVKKKENTVKLADNSMPDDKGTTVTQHDSAATGGDYYTAYAAMIDKDTTDEISLVNQYRKLAKNHLVKRAIREIVNESIVLGEDYIVSLDFVDEDKHSEKMRNLIRDEFEGVLKILNFTDRGQHIFEQWYIDGRKAYFKVVDKSSPRKGVVELQELDVRYLQKKKELLTKKDERGFDTIIGERNYYSYIISAGNTKKILTLTPESVAYCTSGLVEPEKGWVLSYLDDAIRPANQLRMTEDSILVYRWSRAPEKRVFYVDTGNVPRAQADQALREIMARYRNKVSYNKETGEVADSANHMSMLEDIWLTRVNGSKGTEVSTLPGGQGLGQLEDLEYFHSNLLDALIVPRSRLETQSGFSLGRTTEITRDEVRFYLFITNLRQRFTTLFDDILKTQLILKKILKESEWNELYDNITYRFASNSMFSEFKKLEILDTRLNILREVDGYVGKYFDEDFIFDEVLNFTDEQKQKILDGREEVEDDEEDVYSAPTKRNKPVEEPEDDNNNIEEPEDEEELEDEDK